MPLTTRIIDLRREIRLAVIQIKEKMTIYLRSSSLPCSSSVKALAFALQQP